MVTKDMVMVGDTKIIKDLVVMQDIIKEVEVMVIMTMEAMDMVIMIMAMVMVMAIVQSVVAMWTILIIITISKSEIFAIIYCDYSCSK